MNAATSSPAFYEERIRLLREKLRVAECAFSDCLIALAETDPVVATRLRERWFDVETRGAPA